MKCLVYRKFHFPKIGLSTNARVFFGIAETFPRYLVKCRDILKISNAFLLSLLSSAFFLNNVQFYAKKQSNSASTPLKNIYRITQRTAIFQMADAGNFLWIFMVSNLLDNRGLSKIQTVNKIREETNEPRLS